ncbi:phosphoribosylanthranilate isomerase [Polymorphobacter fuscus]|uniref:N-(5'-phosphoribosyl)anthranilate isomerase n=1 Tax=Sandarakinorhabdus fusca TaxID=1439888 RepID=A0A7C9KKX6_9SPHN|nr:phosphoribosylanthranilate isomerase [Polymorphobacter fuscus]KAB7648407.1 phosphoribosylanthranilate isomerase [Polymorphobacter fuscus]MQT15924.1 phosphoribosylanthranilate isomerase [Polymorphobacter fuscus]NJC07800.1 phosphoribosylanthranilate isomerase [Polymorphobacter fuscus]
MTRIKICCIASLAEMRAAIAAGSDAVGLVARMPSGPGPIADDRIAAIAAAVPPPVAAFLLTSETRADAIADHVRRTGVPVVQIVSHIDPDESARLAQLLPHTRRVQVIHVEGPGAVDMIPRYAPHIHAFLLDSGRPGAVVPMLGGTGAVHDWATSAAFVAASPHPVFLAGGLTADNVGDAIARVKPFGVDACSGLRTDGALDTAKLAAFAAAVRQADR